MGRKRKRGQTKQSGGITGSRKQKKRRKTRGNGFNRSAEITKDVDVCEVKLSNSSALPLSLHKTSSPYGEGNQDLTFPCCSKKLRLRGISTIFSRLTGFTRMFQRTTLERFSSIRNVFLLIDWLKQTFGCGLQTLGKFLLEKHHLSLAVRRNNFEELMRRMESLEEEVNVLKTELSKKQHNSSCREHSGVCMSAGQRSVLPSLPLTVVSAPPPPPPPPPPPVIPPPPPPLAFLKKKESGNLNGMVSKETKIMPPKTLVTLEDLKNVKLRKVDKFKDKENLTPNSESETRGFQSAKRELNKGSAKKIRPRKDLPQCVISLKEIKTVTLKRTKTFENEVTVEKIKLRTPEEMVVMRRNLRKVNIARSPGGTPMVSDRNYENGTGLTPMMTRALRKKFQKAHPYSPESPTGIRRKRKSFSPFADHSPNTPSPLLINNS